MAETKAGWVGKLVVVMDDESVSKQVAAKDPFSDAAKVDRWGEN